MFINFYVCDIAYVFAWFLLVLLLIKDVLILFYLLLKESPTDKFIALV